MFTEIKYQYLKRLEGSSEKETSRTENTHRRKPKTSSTLEEEKEEEEEEEVT